MKIPEKIRIGGVDYAVTDHVENLNDGKDVLLGQINYQKSTIQIKAGIGYQVKCITLLHEVLHGIREHAGLAIENEEDVVEMFARGLYQVLQDNARALFDIVPAEQGKRVE